MCFSWTHNDTWDLNIVVLTLYRFKQSSAIPYFAGLTHWLLSSVESQTCLPHWSVFADIAWCCFDGLGSGH